MLFASGRKLDKYENRDIVKDTFRYRQHTSVLFIIQGIELVSSIKAVVQAFLEVYRRSWRYSKVRPGSGSSSGVSEHN